MSDDGTQAIVVVIAVTVYWTIRGLIGMFQRYNAILVVLYLVFLFPIAYLHLFLLGVFGDSKKTRLEKAAKEEAKKQALIEKELEKLEK
jgi:hypothetical protein